MICRKVLRKGHIECDKFKPKSAEDERVSHASISGGSRSRAERYAEAEWEGAQVVLVPGWGGGCGP